MDFDGDGNNDILSGSYPGELYLFKGQGGGKFAPSEQIKHADGKPVKLGFAAAVYAHDWDGDADLDLLVGDIEGQVHLVPNEGSRGKNSFGAATLLQAGNQLIKVNHGDAGPSVADWDGDGKADLLVGNGAGGVVWYRNTGEKNAPKLAAAEVLVPDVMGPQADGAAPAADAAKAGPKRGTRTKVHAVDWNLDGKLDLLVGDFVYTEAPQPVLTEAQQKVRQEKRSAWMKEYNALQEAPLNETKEARQARMKKTADLITKFKELNGAEVAPKNEVSQYHGYVWLFLRQEGVAKAE